MEEDEPIPMDKPRATVRTRMHVSRRPWKAHEDLVIIPVLLACDRECDHFAACRFLCRVLRREPQYADDDHPEGTRVIWDSHELLNMRTITRTLSDRSMSMRQSAMTIAAEMYGGGRRAGLDLTWNEIKHFLKPYADKFRGVEDGKSMGWQPRAEFPDLMCLLERPSSENARVEKTIRRVFPLEVSWKPAEGTRRFTPTEGDNVHAAIEAFLESEERSERFRMEAWNRLHAVCLTD